MYAYGNQQQLLCQATSQLHRSCQAGAAWQLAVQKNDSGVGLFSFPKDEAVRSQWMKQVQQTRAKWNATKYSALCSEHFEASCFKEELKMAAQLGVAMRRQLKPGAVPSIFERPSHIPVHSSKDGRSYTRKRTAGEAGCSSMTAASFGGGCSRKGAGLLLKKRENSRVRLAICTRLVIQLLDAICKTCTDNSGTGFY